jgi:hypothetical protein
MPPLPAESNATRSKDSACLKRMGATWPTAAAPRPAIAPIKAIIVSPRARLRRRTEPIVVESHFESATPKRIAGTPQISVVKRLPVPSPAPMHNRNHSRNEERPSASVVSSLMKSTANSLRSVIGYISSLPASNCLLPPNSKAQWPTSDIQSRRLRRR